MVDPTEKQRRIFNLLIPNHRVKHERGPHHGISKYKARLVMNGNRAQFGVDVFDTYVPLIDYSAIRLLTSLAVGIR